MSALKLNQNHDSEEGKAEEVNPEKQQEIKTLITNIGGVLNDPDWKKFFSNKTIQDYENYLAVQNGEILDDNKKTMGYTPQPDPPKYLKMTYEGMLREGRLREQRFQPIQMELNAAVIDKAASEADVKFLTDWILSGEYNFDATNAPKFAEVIKRKTGDMRNEKKTFEVISKSKFAKDVTTTGPIKLNDEQSFLGAKIDERRKFNKEVGAQIMKMEVEDAIEKKNEGELKKLYLKRLKARLCNGKGKGGSVGKTTFEAYAKELEKQDLEGLKYWHQEFETQMKPRDQFWSTVRSTLKGDGLRDMESLMNEVSLKQAKKEFEVIKADESSRLCASYSKALNQYKGKLFGDHTDRAFRQWMSEQPLSTQYSAEAKLEGEMFPYKRLWQEVENDLTVDQQNEMREALKDPRAGLTQYREKLKELKNADQERDNAEVHQIRNQLDSAGQRKIDSTLKLFDKLSAADQDAFIQIVTQANRGQTRSQFDAQIQQAKQESANDTQQERFEKQEPVEHNQIESTQAPVNDFDYDQTIQKEEIELANQRAANQANYEKQEERTSPLKNNERTEQIEVKKFRGYQEAIDKDKNKRSATIMVNDRDSLEASLRAHRQKNYKDSDQVTLTHDTGSGAQAANSKTALAMEEILKAKRKANQGVNQ